MSCIAILAHALLLLNLSPAFAVVRDETVGQALCRLVETSAKARGLPVPFLTRLIWQESSFRTTAISRAGAQGIAQFMPGTAQERGLADPFDPEQAIPAAAHFLSDLRTQFGNLGWRRQHTTADRTASQPGWPAKRPLPPKREITSYESPGVPRRNGKVIVTAATRERTILNSPAPM